MSDKKTSDLYVDFARPQALWLQVIRDTITELGILERRVHDINDTLMRYYQGELVDIDAVKLKNERESLIKVVELKEKYINRLLDEASSLSGPEHALIVDYLFDPEMTMTELAEDYGLTYNKVKQTLIKYERQLDTEKKSRSIESGHIRKLRDSIVKLKGK